MGWGWVGSGLGWVWGGLGWVWGGWGGFGVGRLWLPFLLLYFGPVVVECVVATKNQGCGCYLARNANASVAMGTSLVCEESFPTSPKAEAQNRGSLSDCGEFSSLPWTVLFRHRFKCLSGATFMTRTCWRDILWMDEILHHPANPDRMIPLLI